MHQWPDKIDDGLLLEQLNVSRETLSRFHIYFQLLKKWQKKTNIVAPSTIGQFWQRHIEDSLRCIHILPEKRHWVDIGTGGGFPGLVIAIALADNKGSTVSLVDSNLKKCAFLRTVIRETGVSAEVIPQRIEQVIHKENAPEVVTARALTELDGLMHLCEPWLSQSTIGLFHKGRDYRRELEKTNGRWTFDLIEHPSEYSAESVILELSNLKPYN
jgi:16S rRNA (guanine527-N7)-methyltransferase